MTADVGMSDTNRHGAAGLTDIAVGEQILQVGMPSHRMTVLAVEGECHECHGSHARYRVLDPRAYPVWVCSRQAYLAVAR